MSRIFCIANQKGGVGKTTTTVNLAAALAKIGQRVLVVDLDPQGNATMGSGIDKRKLEISLYDVLLESASIAEARQVSEKGGYHVLGANRELSGAEIELVPLDRRNQRLRDALAGVNDDYDFVLIDCPPSLGVLTVNGLTAADQVLVPLQCEALSHRGVAQLLDTIADVREFTNHRLRVRGVIATMFDPRGRHAREVLDDVQTRFGLAVLDPPIPKTVRFAEAPGRGVSILEHAPRSAGAQAYREIAAALHADVAGEAPLPEEAAGA